MRVRTILIIVFLFCAWSIAAQTVTIGNVFIEGQYKGEMAPGEVRTYVDLAHPATANGTVTRAGFAWFGWGDVCPESAKIKFFRREGSILTMVAERGPFSFDKPDSEIFPLSPPVDVLQGDLIAITRLATDCGFGPVVMIGSGEYVRYPTDVTGSVNISGGIADSGAVAVWGIGDSSETAVGVLPVVGSTEGSMGSNWKTSVQLLNPHSATANGRLVFRRAGVAGSDADPSYTYSLAAGATQVIYDIVEAMGEKGIGSIDVLTDAASAEAGMPVIIAHIFNDAGDGGTFGFAEEAFDPKGVASQCTASSGTFVGTRILRAGVSGFLIAPASATKARFNIGVRTLGAGATVSATLYTAAGALVATVTKDYPANYFVQLPAGDLLGVPLVGGESITITITTGSAIVYGVANDNVSNDPRMQYVYSRSPAIAQ